MTCLMLSRLPLCLHNSFYHLTWELWWCPMFSDSEIVSPWTVLRHWTWWGALTCSMGWLLLEVCVYEGTMAATVFGKLVSALTPSNAWIHGFSSVIHLPCQFVCLVCFFIRSGWLVYFRKDSNSYVCICDRVLFDFKPRGFSFSWCYIYQSWTAAATTDRKKEGLKVQQKLRTPFSIIYT